MTESQDERMGLPSASQWRRLELCPGSWQLGQEARKLGQLAHETSRYAERGTLIHQWLAGIPDEDGKEIVLSDSESQTAGFLVERACGERLRIFADEQVQQLDEKRLWLTLNGKKALSGRFDRVIYTPTVALLQDFKTGFSEPDPAEQNAQLKVLAVLVALHLPTVREVICQIVSGPYGVSEARYDRPALKDAWDGIVATLRAMHEPSAPLTPGVEQCKWCPAKLICSAVKNQIYDPITKLAFSDLPEGGERAAKLLDEVTILAGLLEQIEEFYKAKFNDPTYTIPGYAMVPGVVRREVSDWDVARSRLAEYLDVTVIKGAANYRLMDLEKALGKVLKLKGVQLKDRMNQILDGLIIEKQNASSLKRVSGKPRLVEVTLP